jgi:hypothetical protein
MCFKVVDFEVVDPAVDHPGRGWKAGYTTLGTGTGGVSRRSG